MIGQIIILTMIQYKADGTLPRKQQGYEKWSPIVLIRSLFKLQEQKIYLELVNHYEKDYNSIARQMNRTFFDKVYQPHRLKRIWMDLQPETTGLTNSEAKKVFKLYPVLLKSKRRHICNYKLLNLQGTTYTPI